MSYLPARLSRLGLRGRLVGAFLALGLLPALAIGWLSYSSASRQVSTEISAEAQSVAEQINDEIDRNLFERYGDVQAFATNPVLLERGYWYKRGEASNAIVRAANTYVALYGLYTVTLVVDRNGRVIAVNDRDAAGKAIESAWIYERNFADAPWFKDALAERFLTQDGSPLTGTVVEDAHADELSARTYGNDGVTVGFSAPIRDRSGEIVGVWHNLASITVVDEIVRSVHAQLAQKGKQATSITVFDRTGRILAAFDPHSGNNEVTRNLEASATAQSDHPVGRTIAGESGAGRYYKSDEGLWQIAGYSSAKGALGYAGLKWGVVAAADEDIALASVYELRNTVLLFLGIGAALIVVVGTFLGKSVASPLLDLTSQLRGGTDEVVAAANQVATSAQSLSEGATEQAASLEQTSASMEEMSAMTRQNAENSQRAAALMTDVERNVADSNGALQQMVTSMAHIQESSTRVSKIIKTIDEIAFQTNILALNAAVEAARAGEAGMGFAVVADEVRNLAQRSAQAARDTSALIVESSQSAEKGGATVQDVVSAISQITSSVGEVKRLVDEVSLASAQQAQGIDQVTQAVSQMEKVTQSTAATAEESAAASEQLSAQSETARSLIGQLDRIVAGEQPTAAPRSTGHRARHAAPVAPAATVANVAAMRPRPKPVAKPAAAPASPVSRAEEEIPFGDTGTYGRF